jgi:uncharacterized membrane protein (UPF0127 family)
MTVLENYLSQLNNDLDNLLSKYTVITYDNPKDIEKGLLRFKEPLKDKAFLFIFPEEEILHFHTIGMKFPIDIFFFNSKKELVKTYKNVKPGIEDISSIKSSKYAVEISG